MAGSPPLRSSSFVGGSSSQSSQQRAQLGWRRVAINLIAKSTRPESARSVHESESGGGSARGENPSRFVRSSAQANQANKAHGFSFCLSHSSDFQGLTTSRGVGTSHAEGGAARPRSGINGSAANKHDSCRAPGDVAQLGEHLLCKQGVSGSSPLISTSTLTTE